jgi:hypothetical protein
MVSTPAPSGGRATSKSWSAAKLQPAHWRLPRDLWARMPSPSLRSTSVAAPPRRIAGADDDPDPSSNDPSAFRRRTDRSDPRRLRRTCRRCRRPVRRRRRCCHFSTSGGPRFETVRMHDCPKRSPQRCCRATACSARCVAGKVFRRPTWPNARGSPRAISATSRPAAKPGRLKPWMRSRLLIVCSFEF